MTILEMKMLCGRGDEGGVELVMDEWRDEKRAMSGHKNQLAAKAKQKWRDLQYPKVLW